ncbi:MAG: hypothetical protein WD359_06785, partial [Dehalococcoidia bacterium]
MQRRKIALAVDEEAVGQPLQQVLVVHRAAAVEQHGHRDAQVVEERPRVLLVVLVVDGEHLEAFVALFIVEFLDVRQFVAARAAPRCPEIHEDDLAPQIAELDDLAVCVTQGEVGRRRAQGGAAAVERAQPGVIRLARRLAGRRRDDFGAVAVIGAAGAHRQKDAAQ